MPLRPSEIAVCPSCEAKQHLRELVSVEIVDDEVTTFEEDGETDAVGYCPECGYLVCESNIS
jgi:hypothetical protein